MVDPIEAFSNASWKDISNFLVHAYFHSPLSYSLILMGQDRLSIIT